jgi:hypothetical protein
VTTISAAGVLIISLGRCKMPEIPARIPGVSPRANGRRAVGWRGWPVATEAEGQEVEMPELPADPDRPEPDRPAAPRRVVADWEYRTTYIPDFQLRLPPGLYERLRERAKRERKSLNTLIVEILEEAVRRRGGWHE